MGPSLGDRLRHLGKADPRPDLPSGRSATSSHDSARSSRSPRSSVNAAAPSASGSRNVQSWTASGNGAVTKGLPVRKGRRKDIDRAEGVAGAGSSKGRSDQGREPAAELAVVTPRTWTQRREESDSRSLFRAGLCRLGHRVADLGGVDELLEADDLAAADDEVVGDADVDVLAGGLVGGGVAGEDDDVLAVDDVGVVVGDPVVPVAREASP